MKFVIEVKDEQLANVICSGYEGGIRYWCDKAEFTELPVPGLAPDDDVMARYFQPLVGGSIRVRRSSDSGDKAKWFTLDGPALLRGLKVIAEKYPHHLAAAVHDDIDHDATTGDVLIQCSIFGEILYG